MIAYTLKTILETLPEATPFVKQASVDQEFPLDNADSCVASAIVARYAQEYEYSPISPYLLEKIATATKLYKVDTIVSDLMEKFAKAKEAEKELGLETSDFLQKQAYFGEGLTGSETPLSAHEEAQGLLKVAQILGETPSDKVNLYTGHAHLCKLAAVQSLAVRYQKTKNTDYVKIASALRNVDEFSVKPETLSDLCKTVSELDKQAEEHNYAMRGHNFFEEALTVKQAAFESSLFVKLAGKDVPYKDIKRLGKDRISEYLGKEAGAKLTGTAKNDIKELEKMGRDQHRVILKMLKSA